MGATDSQDSPALSDTMANGFFTQFKDELGQGNIDLLTDTIKFILVDTDYTELLGTHDNLDDIPAGGRVGTAQTLANPTLVDGVFDGDDGSFTGVTNSEDVAGVVMFKDTGVESTSTLIAFWDTDSGGVISITPNGGDVTVTWDSGANKIFVL